MTKVQELYALAIGALTSIHIHALRPSYLEDWLAPRMVVEIVDIGYIPNLAVWSLSRKYGAGKASSTVLVKHRPDSGGYHDMLLVLLGRILSRVGRVRVRVAVVEALHQSAIAIDVVQVELLHLGIPG